jgi:hypothetical protein
MESDNNLIELAKLIFESDPKPPYSIQMQIEDYECIEDLFEVLLHLFIYGFKLKEINVQNINSLKPYFHSIGVNFVVDIIAWSEYEFLTNKKYLDRYCSIGASSFEDTNLSNLQFILSRNFKPQDSLDTMTAVYNHEIKNNFRDSFICFLSFNYKIEF